MFQQKMASLALFAVTSLVRPLMLSLTLLVTPMPYLLADQNYPLRPIQLVAPYGPGGAADLSARILSHTAPRYLGGDILVLNRSGASGVIGSTAVSRAKPDGYTLLLARAGSQSSVPAINPNIPYRWNDFTFIALLEQNPFVITVHENSRFQDLADLKHAIKEGETILFASAGIGTLLHIGTLMLFNELDATSEQAIHIPFSGGGEALTALLGQHVDLVFQNYSAATAGISAGKIRPLAITSHQRLPSIPEVPTVGELGYHRLHSITGWSALYGPPGLDKAVVDHWQDTLQQLKMDPQWLSMTRKLNSVPDIRNQEETNQFVEAQFLQFKALVERLDIAISY